MASFDKHSFCKINLLLNILGKRPDGFHELETVMQPIPVCDTLSFQTLPTPSLELSCDHPALPTDSSNLVFRAASSFQKASGIRTGVRIHLQKRIPMAAGLGGGSSNAATTLLGLNEMFGHPLHSDELQDLAAQLGSDVPFFLQSQPALATGRGERTLPLPAFPALKNAWVLLVHPGFGVATAWAYQALAAFPEAARGAKGRAESLVRSLQTESLPMAATGFYNSLEAPVLHKYPVMALYQEFFRCHGALAALMSGSGSTTFALTASQAAAEELVEKFKGQFGSQNWTAIAQL